MQQLIELQQENITFQKEEICNWPNDNTYLRKLEIVTTASDSSD